MVKAILLAAAALTGGEPLPLPAKLDIPDYFSTKLCPDERAANRLLADFYASSNPPINLIDIPLLMRGLEETGCEQKAGPVEIREVLARRTIDLGFSQETHIAYRGVAPDDRTVYGVVDEGWNDRLPRTPLEAFTQMWTNDGWLPPAGAPASMVAGMLLCPTVERARATIEAIAGAKASDEEQQRAFDIAVAREGCVPVAKRYRVTAVNENAWIGCGDECATTWTALTAEDEKGAPAGLLFGISEY